HVLHHDGVPTRVELGTATEIEAAIHAWRAALGKPLDGEVAPAGGDRERETGEALRRLLVDPVIAAAGPGTRALHVASDDVLFLVPLDALPLESGRVGDRFELVNEVSFARLLAPPVEVDGEPALVALGAVDYDAVADDLELASADASSPPVGRGGPSSVFAPLPGTAGEVEAAARSFESA